MAFVTVLTVNTDSQPLIYYSDPCAGPTHIDSPPAEGHGGITHHFLAKIILMLTGSKQIKLIVNLLIMSLTEKKYRLNSEMWHAFSEYFAGMALLYSA